MEDMQEYAAMMADITAKIAAKSKEIKKYEDIEAKLNALSSNLPGIKDDLVSAEDDCLSGGFSIGGEAYGQGRFQECYSKIGSAIELIDGVIGKIQTKLRTLKEELNDLKRQSDNIRSMYKAI